MPFLGYVHPAGNLTFGVGLFVQGGMGAEYAHLVSYARVEMEFFPPQAPPSRESPFRMNWEDQWVWALGMELRPAEKWAIRLGCNHGDTPIPEGSLRPHFPAIAEDHITGGAGFTRGSWMFDLGLGGGVRVGSRSPARATS